MVQAISNVVATSLQALGHIGYGAKSFCNSRLDKHWPDKVANNWDIICLADEFTKGFDDYLRFKRKHKQLYGVCDDGAIEKGVGHVQSLPSPRLSRKEYPKQCRYSMMRC